MPAPSIGDRRAVLASLSRRIDEAWQSFDEPRATEPLLDAPLRKRLEEDLPEAPGELEPALEDATCLLDASVSPSRPLFAAYIGSTGLEVGVLGDALAATYDVNLASSAGGAELIERQTLAWTGQFIGVPHREGAFTSGGMTSNLSALLAARERALPGCREQGLAGRIGAVYCSAEAHHSVVRAVESIGLGGRMSRRIAIDGQRRMRPEALDAAIAADLEAGIAPVAVVATAGTTLTGAIDPLDAVADVCERHGVWLHVDGAYGLPASSSPTVGHRFAGRERADSLALDAHKWMGMQKSCSVVLLRDEAALDAAFGHRARYMLQPEGQHNPVDRTLEYSRPLRSLKLWLAFRAHGAAAFRGWIEHTLGLARTFADLLEADPAFELLHEPQLSTVCFRHLPSGGEEPDAHNHRIAMAAQRDGRIYIAPAELDGRTCLRTTFVNFRTQERDVRLLADVLRELAVPA
jgi:aromatic-L-amino-acid/L-tryptophan decarboxylase